MPSAGGRSPRDEARYDRVPALLATAVATGDDAELVAHMERHSALPGPRADLRLVDTFARATGELVHDGTADLDRLESLLDGWAARSEVEAPVTEPSVILPCAAVAAYGHVGAARPAWWADEMAKIRQAASDVRWRVREMVAVALQRLLESDAERTAAALLDWAGDEDPLVVRGAVAATADPPLLRRPELHAAFTAVQRRAVHTFHEISGERRRDERVRTLRQALGFSLGVVAVGTGDPSVLVEAAELASRGDDDLGWVVRRNLNAARLGRRPDLDGPIRLALGDG